MHTPTFKILLAEDDEDDCLFFKEALEELPIHFQLFIVNNGTQLMKWFTNTEELPHVLFLDLNMPQKNGFECLADIKRKETLESLPVIIFSTSYDKEIANLLHKNGAHYYIRKPSEFSQLKTVLHNALKMIEKDNSEKPTIEKFIIAY